MDRELVERIARETCGMECEAILNAAYAFLIQEMNELEFVARINRLYAGHRDRIVNQTQGVDCEGTKAGTN